MASEDCEDPDLYFSRPAPTFSVTLNPELDRYWELYKVNQYTDLTLVCRGVQFKVHKVIVAAQATCLNKHLTKDSQAMSISYDLDPKIMSKLLECIYRGHLSDVAEDEAGNLAEAAKAMGVRQVEEQCSRVMLSKSSLNIENCLSTLKIALSLGDSSKTAKYQEYALENFPRLRRHPSLTQMNFVLVRWYLSHNALAAANPEDRLSAAIFWLKSNTQNVGKNFPAVLKSLPLKQMSKPFLEQIIDNNTILSDDPGSLALLTKALETEATTSMTPVISKN